MQKKKIFSSIIFLLTGIALFWFLYRDFDVSELKYALKDIRYEWIFFSVGFGMISRYIRTLRWKMLISTMGYKPRTINLFLSVIILYFTNLIIPRGGEVSRCAVVSRYEAIPLVKLAGTVLIERIVDFLVFILIFFLLLIWQFSFLNRCSATRNLILILLH